MEKRAGNRQHKHVGHGLETQTVEILQPEQLSEARCGRKGCMGRLGVVLCLWRLRMLFFDAFAHPRMI